MSQWRLNDDDFEDDDDYSKTNVEKKADAPWTHWGQGHFKVTILFIFQIFYFPKKLFFFKFIFEDDDDYSKTNVEKKSDAP